MIDEKLFQKMEFNPLVPNKLADEYPKLAEIFGKTDDKMLRYILLMYDITSPLKDAYPELSARKNWAATLAGYKNNEDADFLKTFTKEVKTPVYDDKGKLKYTSKSVELHEPMLEAVQKLIIYQNNRLWAMIVTNEQAFYEYQRRVMAEIGGDADKDALSAITVKTKIMESMDDIDKRLDGYYKRLTSGDGELEETITKRKRLRPEDIAANVQTNR